MTRPTIVLLALLLTLSASAFGQVLEDDPLHGFCWGGTPSCPEATVGGVTVTPTSTNPPNFGFSISPGPQTGDYLIDVLVPNDQSTGPFAITGIQGGTANNSAISASATLFSATAWTSGDLDTYLGFSASPTNPIGAFLPATQSVDASATGYFVYQADLGQTQLQPNPQALLGPLLNIAPTLPIGTVIVGFLNTPNGIVATANSGALFEQGPGTTGGSGGGNSGGTVPEPGAIVLLGSALVALFTISRKKLVRS